MLTPKKEFFTRKNKTKLYNKYHADYKQLNDLCHTYINRVNEVEMLMEEYRSTEHIYNLLADAKHRAEEQSKPSIAYTTLHNSTSGYIVLPIQEYENLTLYVNKIANSIGNLTGVIHLVQYLTSKELTIRSN